MIPMHGLVDQTQDQCKNESISFVKTSYAGKRNCPRRNKSFSQNGKRRLCAHQMMQHVSEMHCAMWRILTTLHGKWWGFTNGSGIHLHASIEPASSNSVEASCVYVLVCPRRCVNLFPGDAQGMEPVKSNPFDAAGEKK